MINFLLISPFQILLRFLVQKGICVIPKSSNPARLKENLDVSLILYTGYGVSFIFGTTTGYKTKNVASCSLRSTVEQYNLQSPKIIFHKIRIIRNITKIKLELHCTRSMIL